MKIALLSMPFARLEFPSLALTQLSSELKRILQNKHCIQTIYLNHDFLEIMDYETYKLLTGNSVYIKNPTDCATISEPETMKRSLKQNRVYSGAGEWLFRQLAHPDSQENVDKYFKTYFKNQNETADLLSLRTRLEPFLEKLIQRHQLLTYDIICFTSMFQQINPSLAMVNLIKKKKPSIITVMGGNNLDFAAFVLAKNSPNVDHFIQGCGYEDLGQLLMQYAEASQTSIEVAGSRYIKGHNSDINDAIPLDYDTFLSSFENHFSGTERRPIVFFETSRGCWWGEKSRCKFCDYNKNDYTYRKMDDEKAITYLQHIIDTCRERSSLLWSVDSILPVEYLDSVFPYLNIPPTIQFFYEVRASLNNEQIKKLKYSHISMVQAGIEALDTPTLSLLGKGIHATDNIAFIRNSCLHGVSVLWNILCGIPGESTQRLYDLLDLIPNLFHLYPPTGIWGISYDRQSEYVLHREEYKLDLMPDIQLLQHQFPYSEDDLKQMAYFYTDNDKKHQYTLEKIKVIEKIKEKILAWQNAWKQQDTGLLPRLYVDRRAKGNYVVDSRSGVKKESHLNEETEKILVMFQTPKSSTFVELQRLQHDAKEALKQCLENNWLWEESARIVSLVTMTKPVLPVSYSRLEGWYWE